MPTLSSPRMRAFVLAPLVFCAGCAVLTARHPQPVAASVARDEMRRLETASIELYYPASHADQARRLAERLDRCMEELRSLAADKTPRARAVAVLSSADFNNAFVSFPALGMPQNMVLAHHFGLDGFNALNLGSGDVGAVSCHEAVHYVHAQKVNGFWRGINLLVGELFTPHMFLDGWFVEGLATYYEGKLVPGTGRPHSPVWRGLFEAGVTERGGRLRAGDLSAEQREVPSAPYLAGSHFVEFLARRYGEGKLWEVVDKQGRSIFSPFGVTLRFKSVYGKSVGALLDEFNDELSATLPWRVRPTDQRRLATLGEDARLAVSRAGDAVASVASGLDDVPRLTVRERDGTERFTRRLTQVLPPRTWIYAHVDLFSGLEFTADGRWLFVSAADVTSEGAFATRLLKLDARTGEVARLWEGLAAVGGTVSPDGKSYVYVELAADTSNLVRLDLESGAKEALTRFEGRTSLASPALSPDGTRIAFARRTEQGFDLFLREADGTLRPVTDDGRFNLQPRWIDADRLIFVRERQGRAQAHVADLRTGAISPATDAPHVVLDPWPWGDGTVAFLNREGWHWTLDVAPIPTPATEEATPSPPRPEAASAPDRAAAILEDGPASLIDHLFLPTLRGPFLVAVPMLNDPSDPDSGLHFAFVGTLSLKGSDRLGYHNYAANLVYDGTSGFIDVSAGYGNYLAAPWFLTATAEYARSPQTTEVSLGVGASRSWFDLPVSLSVEAFDRYDEPTETASAAHGRFVGPRLHLSYFAADATPYGGLKRGLGISVAGAYYRSLSGTNEEFGDVAGAVTALVPLPLLKRHEFELGVRGRALPGVARPLLQVGGTSSALAFLLPRGPSGDAPGPTPGFPSALRFGEPLRGYEDFSMVATQVGVGHARYGYSFPIDRGWTSLLYLFPSLFLRQVDVEAFGVAAVADNQEVRWHRAVGAALVLRTSIMVLPVSLVYQFAWRFDDGLAPLHLVGLALE